MAPGAQEQTGRTLHTPPSLASWSPPPSMPRESAIPPCPSFRSATLAAAAGPKGTTGRPRRGCRRGYTVPQASDLGDSQFSQELQTRPSDQGVQIRFRLQQPNLGPQKDSRLPKGLATALLALLWAGTHHPEDLRSQAVPDGSSPIPRLVAAPPEAGRAVRITEERRNSLGWGGGSGRGGGPEHIQ